MGHFGIGGHGRRRHALPPGLEKKEHLPPGWRKKFEKDDDDEDRKGVRDRCDGQSALQSQCTVTGGQGAATVGAGNAANLPAGLPAGIEHIGLTALLQPAPQPAASGGYSIGAQLLNAQYMQPRQAGSAIIDSSVLNAARAGDTVGYINALAGNVNASLNNSIAQFLALTG